MGNLLTAITGDDTGATKILIAHINDVIKLLNGTTAGRLKLIDNVDQQILLQPSQAPSDLTTAILELLSAAGVSLLALRYNGVIESNVAIGTAPLVVTSTTVVANLNADAVDGLHLQAAGAGSVVATAGAATISDKKIGNYIDFDENAAPGNPAVNVARLYGKDDGSGNTIMAFRDSAGAEELLPNLPTGVYLPYGGTSAPSGWLMCNGAAVSRTTYARLFAIVGTAFGVGDGSTTFNVPDLRERYAVGAGASLGRITANPAVGATLGNEAHDHPAFNSASGATASDGSHGGAQTRASETHVHNIDVPSMIALPPSQAGNYIIKT